jgi:hypothetical protein
MGRAAAASCADSFQIVIEELLTCLTPVELELLRCELNRAMDRSSISAWLGIAEGTCGNRWTALRKRVQELLDIQPRRNKRAQESSTEPTRMWALLKSDSGSSFPGVSRTRRAPRPRAVEHSRGTPEHRETCFSSPARPSLSEVPWAPRSTSAAPGSTRRWRSRRGGCGRSWTSERRSEPARGCGVGCVNRLRFRHPASDPEPQPQPRPELDPPPDPDSEEESGPAPDADAAAAAAPDASALEHRSRTPASPPPAPAAIMVWP